MPIYSLSLLIDPRVVVSICFLMNRPCNHLPARFAQSTVQSAIPTIVLAVFCEVAPLLASILVVALLFSLFEQRLSCVRMLAISSCSSSSSSKPIH